MWTAFLPPAAFSLQGMLRTHVRGSDGCTALEVAALAQDSYALTVLFTLGATDSSCECGFEGKVDLADVNGINIKI